MRHQEEFEITITLQRDDLANVGFDITGVDNETMEDIVSDLREHFYAYLYPELDEIADIYEIPRRAS